MTPSLLTERLALRPMDERDVDDLVRLNDDPAVQRFTGDGPVDRAGAAAVLRDRILPQYAHGVGRLAVVGRAGGAFLGWCGLRRDWVGDDVRYDLGYRFHVNARGHGYATEAALAVLADAKVRLPGARIIGRVDPENIPSQRVLERCGLRRAGEVSDGGRLLFVYAL